MATLRERLVGQARDSGAIAGRVAELRAAAERARAELGELESQRLPALEQAAAVALAGRELGEDAGDVEGLRRELAEARLAAEGKRALVSQVQAAVQELERRRDAAKLGEAQQECRALAAQFLEAARQTEKHVLAAAESNRKAEDARHRYRLLADEARQLGGQPGVSIDAGYDQALAPWLGATVTGLANKHGGTLPSDPGEPGRFLPPIPPPAVPAHVRFDIR